jgi:hypothetical protein
MTLVKIICPNTWHDQITWIKENCHNYIDETNWGMWQIGQAYIYFWLEVQDALMFTLKWGHCNGHKI